MSTNQYPAPQTASQLIRTGRYADAVTALQLLRARVRSRDGHADVLLSDALQRIGQNSAAEELALRYLRSLSTSSPLYAHYHFILGNVERDRGNTSNAINHLQIAFTSTTDAELACWIQLRLIGAVAEFSGIRTAIARLDDVKRTLIRFGNARPFAALHLWLVEVESTRGNLEVAWRNLRTAESLLSQVEDLWLQGYLAVNRSALHYYSGEIWQAEEWAKAAINHANESGHRTTRQAAHVNLGNILFSQGQLARAEACFQTALDCSEPASISELIILENIAQIKLHQHDLPGCRNVLLKLEQPTHSRDDAKRRHYSRWALQTKIRLLLQEGKTAEAQQISEELDISARDSPRTRVSAASHLLRAETFLAARDPISAALVLRNLFRPTVHLPADLYAEMERVAGNALAASGATQIAYVHLERARRTFDLLGHAVGKDRVANGLRPDPNAGELDVALISAWCLDRIRVLLDLRSRPELFAQEAVVLLQELECARLIKLNRETNAPAATEGDASVNSFPSTGEITVSLNGGDQPIAISFIPREDTKSTLTALTFQRVLIHMLEIPPPESLVADQEIVWGTTEGTAVSPGVVFAAHAMTALLRTVKQIAPTDVSVLITGETGAGKEVIAKTIHEYSRRAKMPFLALNCAAVSKDLLESQLFGHRKGAFSGAAESHQGIVRAANGGTLFLDEIGEIPVDMQAKLLRFLEMSEVHPVGESHPVKVNVRLIFATNGDLEEAVSQNRFRQDLYYRLNVIPIKVPPLRERREEIPVLANLFAQRCAAEFEKDPLRFSSSAMELLILYSWPGNIRQLANEVRRLAALTDPGTCIEPEHLSPQLQAQALRSRTEAAGGAGQMHIRIDQPLDKATADLESEMIRRALRQAGGRMAAAASTLGISRKGLYLKRLRLGITDESMRAS